LLIQLYLASFLAVAISGLCSIFEAILYSVPMSQVEVMAQSGKTSGRILKNLKKNIHKPITAILTLNTIANTMGAAVAGAFFVATFGSKHLGLFSVGFTLAILFFSEIIPKTVGVAYAKKLAPWIAWPVHWLVTSLLPIVWFTETVARLFIKRTDERLISLEEIQAIAIMSRKSGIIDPAQEKVIANIVRLQDKSVRKVMTPRTVTFMLDEHMTVAEAKALREDWSRHSRVPVYDTDPDDVVGIVLRKDVYLNESEEHVSRPLADLMIPVHFVPEAASINRVLLEFFERRQHLFVVVDEYGSVTGVISLEDIIEEIMGREIIDESDLAGNMREFARKRRRNLRSE